MRAAAAFRSTISRKGDFAPAEHIADGGRIDLGIATLEIAELGRREARVRGRHLEHLISPFFSSATSVTPVVVSSSRPSWPCTTQTCSAPRFFSTWASGSTQPREHAEHLALTPAGIGDGPQQVEDCADAEFGADRRPVLHGRRGASGPT